MKKIEEIDKLKMMTAFLKALANIKLEEDFSLDMVEVEEIKEKVLIMGDNNGKLGRLRF